MKGIILAGGTGTRLYPMTMGVSKQLLPVYDKPMIYYPLSVLLLAGLREILVISTPADLPAIRRLLKDGSQWGIKLQYAEQAEPRGLAEALLIGRDFIAGDSVCLILGDNLLYGEGLQRRLHAAVKLKEGAQIFGYAVRNPQAYGVVTLDANQAPVSIEEKPKQPLSPYAVPGLYFYDSSASAIAAGLKPSARGELEITDVNREYLKRGQLKVEILGRGMAWLDAGTSDSLIQAANFIQAVQDRQGLMVACLEEIAYHLGYINQQQLTALAAQYPNSYGDYLRAMLAK